MTAETLAILESGRYTSPRGVAVEIGPALAAAVAGTRVYRPDELPALLAGGERPPAGPRASIEVTAETTQRALQRLHEEGAPEFVALNFASARNPGGGFLRGAKAQEEDLARASALYPCLLAARAYYDANRLEPSVLYTDHLIYSPAVPFFRAGAPALLEQPFLASVITAPAPNAGQALARDPRAGPAIDAALERRAGAVLAVARAEGHRHLVLGAWGCGVFRNDPAAVAEVFAGWLSSSAFAGAFERVVFAVYGPDRNREAFLARFAADPLPPLASAGTPGA
jgi:uncharacterized protein (TIGR02452 family)